MDAQSGGYSGNERQGSATDPFGRAGAGAQGLGAHGLGGQGLGGAGLGGAQGMGAPGAGVPGRGGARSGQGRGPERRGTGEGLGSDSAPSRRSTRARRAWPTRWTTSRARCGSRPEQLRDQHEQRASQYVDQAAEQLERFGGYLRSADVHDMADRVEDAARRQPALFLGGMLALGLAGARFLKSSRRNAMPQRPSSSYAGSRGYPTLERGPGGYRAGASYGGASRGLGDVSGFGGSGAHGGERDVTSLRTPGAEGSGRGSVWPRFV